MLTRNPSKNDGISQGQKDQRLKISFFLSDAAGQYAAGFGVILYGCFYDGCR